MPRPLLLVVAALVFGSSLAVAGPLAGKRPNVVFIMTDDQGYGDLARHGNPVIQTPNLDRLHDEAARLTDHHVSPTCSPTRAALMTGRHEMRSGVTHTILERERLSLKATTIAQVLKSAGYTTGIFGKWHLGDEAAYRPDRRGFDEVFIHGCGGIGQTYPGSCGDAPGNKYFDPAILHNNKFEKTQGYCTDVFFGQAAKWIETVKGKQPFFAYVTPNAPHTPLDCPPEYEARYPNQMPQQAKFLGMVTNIDDNVGRLLAKLKALGIEKDTLVIFQNDNGGTAGVPVFPAGLRGQKNSPYRGGTRAMGFLRWPGTITPGNISAITAHIDFFPTLAELAGAQLPAGVKLDGRSLVPLLENANATWPERFLFTHQGRWPLGKATEAKFSNCSVRHSRWNLVNTVPLKSTRKDGKRESVVGTAAKWQLYDLTADPGEKVDVATKHPDVVAQMSAAYDRWWAEVLPCLENEDAHTTAPKENPYHTLYRQQFPGEK